MLKSMSQSINQLFNLFDDFSKDPPVEAKAHQVHKGPKDQEV